MIFSLFSYLAITSLFYSLALGFTYFLGFTGEITAEKSISLLILVPLTLMIGFALGNIASAFFITIFRTQKFKEHLKIYFIGALITFLLFYLFLSFSLQNFSLSMSSLTQTLVSSPIYFSTCLFFYVVGFLGGKLVLKIPVPFFQNLKVKTINPPTRRSWIFLSIFGLLALFSVLYVYFLYSQMMNKKQEEERGFLGNSQIIAKEVINFSLSPNRTKLVYVQKNGSVYISEIDQLDKPNLLPIRSISGTISRPFKWSADGEKLLIAENDKLYVWDISTQSASLIKDGLIKTLSLESLNAWWFGDNMVAYFSQKNHLCLNNLKGEIIKDIETPFELPFSYTSDGGVGFWIYKFDLVSSRDGTQALLKDKALNKLYTIDQQGIIRRVEELERPEIEKKFSNQSINPSLSPNGFWEASVYKSNKVCGMDGCSYLQSNLEVKNTKGQKILLYKTDMQKGYSTGDIYDVTWGNDNRTIYFLHGYASGYGNGNSRIGGDYTILKVTLPDR